MSLTAGTKLGPYQILAPLGAGGMGEVYRARDTNLDRDVAIKVLPTALAQDPERLARFEREAKVLAALNHPNIAQIYGVEQGALVMELVEGENLSGPVPLATALDYARQIADALEAAHEKGIVHRDLKPANIKVTPQGVVKVLDFGLAAVMQNTVLPDSNATQSPTLTLAATQMGVLLGTAAYMSPEQARGKPVDKRADIWAFGVVLYEMVTGRQLFHGDDITATLAAVVLKEPDLEAVPPRIRRVLRRCLEKDPKKRLRDISGVDLLLDEEITPAPAAPAPSGSRLLLATAAAAVLFAAAAGVLAFVYFGGTRTEPHAIRFQLFPPEKAAPQEYKLSPDGRFLAFTSQGRLWVRPLDALEAHPLPGAEGVRLPFWSPDGAFLGFFSDGKLKKISINGGPAQTLCDAPNGVGGTWSREGVILFQPGAATGAPLMRVSSAGGVPVAVTSSLSGEVHVHPEFLPDGQHFLYLARFGKPETNGIYAGSLDGRTRERLLADQSNAIYVTPSPRGSGHILFRRENTLMAQPFDAKTLKPVGDVFPLAEQVGIAGFAGYGAFSASQSGVLAYGVGRGGVNQELIWMDRMGKVAEAAAPPGEYGSLRLSPDEKRVVFDRIESSNQDIWVRDLARGVTSRLTFHPATDNLPIWSSDGSRVLFPSRRSGAYDLYIKSAAGAGQEELLVKMGTPRGWGTDWSTDGRFILFMMPGDKTAQDLWVAPQFGDKKPYPYLHESYDETDGVFSPDAHWVAYVSNESGRNQVYVQAFPVSGAKWQISTAGGSDPAWSRDGAELFYLAGDRTLMVTPVKQGTTLLPGTPKPLFVVPGSSARRSFQVSRNAQRFLVARPAGELAAAPLTVVVNWQAGLKK